MKDKLAKALNEVRDSFIGEAAGAKRPGWRWGPAVAAVLALMVGMLIYPHLPIRMQPPVSTSSYGNTAHIQSTPPATSGVWMLADVISLADYSLHTPVQAEGLASSLRHFFGKSMDVTLGQSNGSAGANKAYSPANLYLALSLLAELTGGEEQLMSLLGVENLEMLRENANKLWNSVYLDEEDKVLLANSLWFQEGLEYNQEIMDTLSRTYFSSSFSGRLGSERINQAIGQWINEQTGNLLEAQVKEIQLSPATVFAVYSTIYYQVQWDITFSEKANTEGIFHGAENAAVTYMNKHEGMLVYWGTDFTAIRLGLREGGMWLLLPNEGVTPEEVVDRQEYLDLVLGQSNLENAFRLVNLLLPKFDIQTGTSLIGDLQSLGVTDIFVPGDTFADFLESPVGPLYVGTFDQATRVAVDEYGVTASNYVEIRVPNTGMPPEPMDFILDRPFLFVITSEDALPLFAGIVNDLS